MTRTQSRFSTGCAIAAVLSSALLVSACVQQNTAPQQVQSRNPSVTYKYRGDQELLQANQNAMTFCSQYRSSAGVANIADGPDGIKTVVFDCMPMAAVAVASAPYNPNIAYSYRTDQELLDASRNAESYCMSNGSQRASSSVVSNSNGTRTVTFQCMPR